MTIGLKANNDGSGAVQTGGTDAIQISTSQAVTIPQTLAVTGNLSATGNNLVVSAASGIGYGTGSGGTVTQATSKTTAVTLNKPNGQIVMNAAALAAGASVVFTLNNTSIAAADVLVVAKGTGGSQGGYYEVRVDTVLSGSAVIFVKNISGVSLSEAASINFAVIKAVTA